MKKKVFLPVLAIVAIAGLSLFSAFTKNAPNGHQAEEKWFNYVSGNPALSSSYVINGSGETAPNCPEGDDIRCAVQAHLASGSSNQPDMTTVIDTRDRALETK